MYSEKFLCLFINTDALVTNEIDKELFRLPFGENPIAKSESFRVVGNPIPPKFGDKF